MKTNWLFAMNDYEALGGLKDLKGTFASMIRAKDYAETMNPSYDYYEIVDSKNMNVVFKGHKNLDNEISWEKCCQKINITV